jgi:hypothetical protein
MNMEPQFTTLRILDRMSGCIDEMVCFKDQARHMSDKARMTRWYAAHNCYLADRACIDSRRKG